MSREVVKSWCLSDLNWAGDRAWRFTSSQASSNFFISSMGRSRPYRGNEGDEWIKSARHKHGRSSSDLWLQLWLRIVQRIAEVVSHDLLIFTA
jgi:hypothetical protein